MILLAALLAASPVAAGEDLARVAAKAGFTGTLVVARTGGPTTIVTLGPPGGAPPIPADAVWRWASVTKQIAAVIAMQEVAAGRLDLDAPVTRYLPDAGTPADITVRRLLQHTSGLFDPEDGPKAADGVPLVYRRDSDTLTLAACLKPVRPVGGFRYNNCNFVVAGAVLEATTGQPFARLVETRLARPAGLRSLRLLAPGGRDDITGHDGKGADDRAVDPGRYGAAAGLAGTAQDLARFDMALVDGRLLPAAARAEMWRGDPRLGYVALGQWGFPAKLPGCTAPVTVVERRGGVGFVQVRNLILPDQGLAIVAFTADGEFDFGEIWQGKGFAFDLLASRACKAKP